MVAFQELHNLRLGKLKKAIPQWKTMVGKLERLADGDEGGTSAARLETKAKAAEWKGDNATVTQQFVTKTAREFDDAVSAARSVFNVLQNAHAGFTRHKNDLEEAVSRAKKKGLHVSSTGFVSPRKDADPEPTQKDIDDVVQDIERVLGEANDTDRIAKEALKALAKDKYNFASKATDLTAVRKLEKRQAAADAREAQKIARQKGPVSDDQLMRLDSIFKRQAENPAFATRFYNGLGPEEALRFNTELATQLSLDGDAASLKRAERLQNNMGTALATATKDIGSPGYLSHQWVEELKLAGKTRMNVHIGGGLGVDPYGYQSLGSLMGSGKYSTEFLNAVAQDMIDMDRSKAGDWPSGAGYPEWELDLTDAIRDGDGSGGDPITGLMQAEARTPQAAEHLFRDKDNLEYLLKNEYGDGERADAIGHALESAVYGYPYDQHPDLAPEHSEGQATIMKNVMHMVSRDADLVSDEMADSYGHMAAAYMPEINRALVEGSRTDELFPSGNNVNFGEGATMRFLYALATEPDAYAGVVYGQNAYTANMIEHHMADPPKGFSRENVTQAIGQNAGAIQGIMAQARADEEIGSAVEETNSYNDAIGRQGEFFKTMAAVGVSAGVAAGPTGPAAVGVAALGSFGGGAANAAIEDLYDGRKLEDRDMNAAFFQAGDDYEETKKHTVISVQRAAEVAAKSHDVSWKPGDMEVELESAVRDGWDWVDTDLNTYVNRPDRNIS